MSNSGSCRGGDCARARRSARFWRWVLAVILVAGCASDGGVERATDEADRRAGGGAVATSAQAAPPELRAAYIAAVQAGAS